MGGGEGIGIEPYILSSGKLPSSTLRLNTVPASLKDGAGGARWMSAQASRKTMVTRWETVAFPPAGV